MSMSVEDVFDIEIPDETAETPRTVGDLIAYIKAEQYFCFWAGRTQRAFFLVAAGTLWPAFSWPMTEIAYYQSAATIYKARPMDS